MNFSYDLDGRVVRLARYGWGPLQISLSHGGQRWYCRVTRVLGTANEAILLCPRAWAEAARCNPPNSTIRFSAYASEEFSFHILAGGRVIDGLSMTGGAR